MGRKEIVAMTKINNYKQRFASTISYIIPGIILLAVLGLIISSLVLSIAGIILIVVLPIISLIIIGLIISLIHIITNLIAIKTMTGKSKQILFFQRVEVGANP